MITSMNDVIVELFFQGLSEWQIKKNTFEITDTAISFTENGNVIWRDDYSTDKHIRESGSYIIAEKMKWRFA